VLKVMAMEKAILKERVLSIKEAPTKRSTMLSILAQLHLQKGKELEQALPKEDPARVRKILQLNQEEQDPRRQKRPDRVQLEVI
jgi:hypothetical protein